MSIYGPLTSDRFAYELCIAERFEALRPMSSEQVKDFAQDFSPSCRPAQTTARMVALQCLVEILAGRLGQEIALSEVREEARVQAERAVEELRRIMDGIDEPNPCADPFNPVCDCVHCQGVEGLQCRRCGDPGKRGLGLCEKCRSELDPATAALEAMTAADVALSEAAKGARL